MFQRTLNIEQLERKDLFAALVDNSEAADTDIALMAGDANGDLKFDQLDIVQVLQVAKYLTGEPATFEEGDWTGDGLFNQLDIVAALQVGNYLQGPYAAVSRSGIQGDDQTSVVYNPQTGEFALDAPAGGELTSINIDSAGCIFTSNNNPRIGAVFEPFNSNCTIFEATFGGSFGSRSFGNVAQTGLSEQFVLNDLTVVGSLAGGGGLGDVDLVYTCGPHDRDVTTQGLSRFASTDELEELLREDAQQKSRVPSTGGIGNFGGSFNGGGGSFAIPTHSQTNTQVTTVDEADLVETDGNYLYVLSDDDLLIADTWPADELRLVSRWEIGEPAWGQYLNGDRLTIVSRPNNSRVKVTMLDVSDRGAPALIQETEFDGTYVQSRAIGDFVYVVSADAFGLTREEARQPFEGRVLELGLPHFSSFDANGQLVASGLLSEPTDIYRPIVAASNLLSLVAFDVSSDQSGPVSTTSVPAALSTHVYASPSSVYLVNPNCGLPGSQGEVSSVFQFDITDGGSQVDFAAAGNVRGRPLNSFSIDEHDGNVRIATHEGVGRNMQSFVSVLSQVDNELQVIGQTENLISGESIRSVRFMEDTGYVVTFPEPEPQRRWFVDPLFTVDLADPANPTVLGELEIRGFSTYLHSVGDDYLLGLGRDADPNTGRVRQIQVSLFDVSDLSQPTLAERFEFPLPRWAQTEATDDHHAVAYYPEHQVLAFPITSQSQTELWVFRIELPTADDQSSTVELLGRIDNESQIRRSVRIEDFLYAIAEDSLTVHPILDPQQQVARVSFVQEAGDSNGDGRFDQRDIAQVLQSNKYLTGEAAVWSEGDWDRDGLFNQLDIVKVLQDGRYMPTGARRDV